MICRQENGKLYFVDANLEYTLESGSPEDPEKLVIEHAVVTKILNDKGSGSGWTASVANQLNDRLRHLEEKFMEKAKQNIVRK